MAARTAGMDFDELVWRVLETSFVRTVDGAKTMLNRNAYPSFAATRTPLQTACVQLAANRPDTSGVVVSALAVVGLVGCSISRYSA